jgi:rhamnosyltransferase
VVVPVKNESAGIAACLEGILSQTVPVEEIIVIDSSSTDGTQEIVGRYPKVRLLEIPPSEFNHGDTRNLGAREARGDLVLFTVGDARAASADWIAQLLAGFVTQEVVAVCGSQVTPQSDATNPVQWFRPRSQPQVTVFQFEGRQGFERATVEERWQATSVDDVTAIYRRAIFREIPFRRVVYGEDVLFAADALMAGHAIAFNPAARVYHYHHESYATVLKRTIAVASLRYQVTGYLTPLHPLWTGLARALVRLGRTPSLTWRSRAKWARYNLDTVRAVRDGLAKVHAAHRRGGDAMQQLHEAYCGTPPIPLKGAARTPEAVR